MPRILQEEINALLRSHGYKPPGSKKLSWLASAARWLSKMLSESDDEPSVRRVVYFLVHLAAVLLCFLSVWRDIPTNAQVLAITLVTTSTGAVTVGRFAEAKDSGKGGGE